MVDATATATADDTANCPAPPRGSVLRSSGSDRKSGALIGWTHSAGKAPERLNTAPNFHPETRSRGITAFIHTHTMGPFPLKPPSVLINTCRSSISRSALASNRADPYLQAFGSHLQPFAHLLVLSPGSLCTCLLTC